jgi:prolyl oligopeptidase
MIAPADTIKTLPYPKTAKGNVTDDYFGTIVPDPYRWLENDTSVETKAWVEAENKVTLDYLEQIPYREAIKKRLEVLWNYEKFSAPFKEGNYTYFYKNDGLQNQSVLS